MADNEVSKVVGASSDGSASALNSNKIINKTASTPKSTTTSTKLAAKTASKTVSIKPGTPKTATKPNSTSNTQLSNANSVNSSTKSVLKTNTVVGKRTDGRNSTESKNLADVNNKKAISLEVNSSSIDTKVSEGKQKSADKIINKRSEQKVHFEDGMASTVFNSINKNTKTDTVDCISKLSTKTSVNSAVSSKSKIGDNKVTDLKHVTIDLELKQTDSSAVNKQKSKMTEVVDKSSRKLKANKKHKFIDHETEILVSEMDKLKNIEVHKTVSSTNIDSEFDNLSKDSIKREYVTINLNEQNISENSSKFNSDSVEIVSSSSDAKVTRLKINSGERKLSVSRDSGEYIRVEIVKKDETEDVKVTNKSESDELILSSDHFSITDESSIFSTGLSNISIDDEKINKPDKFDLTPENLSDLSDSFKSIESDDQNSVIVSFPSQFNRETEYAMIKSTTLQGSSKNIVGASCDLAINTSNDNLNGLAFEHSALNSSSNVVESVESVHNGSLTPLNSSSVPNEKDVSDSVATTITTSTIKTSDSETVSAKCNNNLPEQPVPSVENPAINGSPVSPPQDAKEIPEPTPLPEESKHSIRLKVWDLLEKNNYVLFPRPCKGRIPHFVGSPEAGDRLATLEEFKKSKNVKVNPDKPQGHVRYLTLEAGKNLLVPIPRLRSGLLRRIVPPSGASKEEIKAVITQQGIFASGQPVNLDDKISIDLVVMGAVAVSKEGHRIGKGEGYADLEFAILMKMGAITPDTVVITTVHDEQVFDTLPHHLFKEHDVPVDFIVTPTQVFEVKPRLPKPTGIFWNLLSNRRLNLIPILKTLREQEIGEGKDCSLKEIDSDREDRPMKPMRFPWRFPRRSYRDSQIQGRNRRQPRESSAPPTTPNNRTPQKSRQSRTFHRKPAAARSSSAKEQPARNMETGNNSRKKRQNIVERVRAGGDGVRPTRRYFRRPRDPIIFSIRVSGISQGTRVRDLKSALSERGVKPYDITWESNKGSAVLHFTKDEIRKDKSPQVLSEITSVSVVEGLPAKLELKMLGNAAPYKYEWRANGNPVNKNGRCKLITRLNGTAALLIGNVKMEDAGEYTVTIRNKYGEVISKGSLSVEAKVNPGEPEKQPSFGEEVTEISADKNSQLLISLPISGNPVPDAEWSKDDVVLSQTNRLQFLCDGKKVELMLNQCRINDSGIYKCKLTNSLGEAECSIKVTVNAPPRINQVNNVTKDITVAMDDMIVALQDLKVKHDGDKDLLSIEPANPISRIESTGISAV